MLLQAHSNMTCPNCGNTEYSSVPLNCTGNDYLLDWNLQLRFLPGPVKTEADAHDSILRLCKMQLHIYGPSAREPRDLVLLMPPSYVMWMWLPSVGQDRRAVDIILYTYLQPGGDFRHEQFSIALKPFFLCFHCEGTTRNHAVLAVKLPFTNTIDSGSC